VLQPVTGFSIDLDTSTIHGKSYLDIRARFAINGSLCNFHLMTASLHSEHTGEQMFKTMTTFLDALVSQLKHILVGVSTDGEEYMTGRLQGLATRIEGVVPAKKLIRVWCRPNTTTVESGFSIMGWEKDLHRKSLTDFSLEGVMHAKQFKRLQELATTLEAKL
ncbi:hypothetical protein JG687_00009683, partial [Phytophthora cactorum]